MRFSIILPYNNRDKTRYILFWGVMKVKIETVGVVGAGAWGTALAQSVTVTGKAVCLWGYEEEAVDNINSLHENSLYLPGVTLNATSLAKVSESDILLLVPPAQAMRQVAKQLAPLLGQGHPVMICSKGIEQKTGKLLTEVIAEEMPQVAVSILSGPSFADDVARGLPTAVTLACDNEKLGYELIKAIGHRNFRPYYSSDMLGAQIGGAVKNVLAIAAGIVVGKKIGASAHAALTTRGFAELVRFGVFHKANRETLKGLSGLGDLILTCSSEQSRNMSLGKALGEGDSLEDILGARHSVSEGVFTAKAVARIAKQHDIEMPICQAVNAIITGQINVDDAIAALLMRPFKGEEV